jgi:hypothetical protein
MNTQPEQNKENIGVSKDLFNLVNSIFNQNIQKKRLMKGMIISYKTGLVARNPDDGSS